MLRQAQPVMSLAGRLPPLAPFARSPPSGGSYATFRASSLRWTCAASKTLRLRHPRLHALHYAQGVRAYGAHSTCPHAPQKSRHAALFDYAQSAACHAFCGDGACPVELATLGGQPLRGFRGSTAGNPPTQAALQAALTPADVLRLKQKGFYAFVRRRRLTRAARRVA